MDQLSVLWKEHTRAGGETGSRWPAHEAHKQFSNHSNSAALERLRERLWLMAQRLDVCVGVSRSTMTNGPVGALELFWKSAFGCENAPGDWELGRWA